MFYPLNGSIRIAGEQLVLSAAWELTNQDQGSQPHSYQLLLRLALRALPNYQRPPLKLALVLPSRMEFNLRHYLEATQGCLRDDDQLCIITFNRRATSNALGEPVRSPKVALELRYIGQLRQHQGFHQRLDKHDLVGPQREYDDIFAAWVKAGTELARNHDPFTLHHIVLGTAQSYRHPVALTRFAEMTHHAAQGQGFYTSIINAEGQPLPSDWLDLVARSSGRYRSLKSIWDIEQVFIEESRSIARTLGHIPTLSFSPTQQAERIQLINALPQLNTGYQLPPLVEGSVLSLGLDLTLSKPHTQPTRHSKGTWLTTDPELLDPYLPLQLQICTRTPDPSSAFIGLLPEQLSVLKHRASDTSRDWSLLSTSARLPRDTDPEQGDLQLLAHSFAQQAQCHNAERYRDSFLIQDRNWFISNWGRGLELPDAYNIF